MKLSYITEDAFLHEIKSSVASGSKRYCFILGAGASISSGIPSGQRLAMQWLQEIKNGIPDKASTADLKHAYSIEIDRRIEVLEKAAQKPLKAKYKRFRDINYDPDTYNTLDDYSNICELRFIGNQHDENKSIRAIMENKTPYVGYFALASIVAQTTSDRIITLNFDQLAEKALQDYTRCQYDVIAHENIAYFADETITGKPKILKIHRDYTTGCFNTADLLKELNPKWVPPLDKLFDEYIPIVIGYAGTDHTLMDYLKKRHFKEIYWCHMYGELPNDGVRSMIEATNGKCVEIWEFDHIMLKLASILCDDPKFEKMIIGDTSGSNASGYFAYYPKNALNSLRTSKKDRSEKSKELYALYEKNLRLKSPAFGWLSLLKVAAGLNEYKKGHFKKAEHWFRNAFEAEKRKGNHYGKAELNLAISLEKSGKIDEAKSIFEKLSDHSDINDKGSSYIKDIAMYHLISILLVSDSHKAKEKALEYLGCRSLVSDSHKTKEKALENLHCRRCDGTFYRLLALAELNLGELDQANEHIKYAVELHNAENNTANYKGDSIVEDRIEKAMKQKKMGKSENSDIDSH